MSTVNARKPNPSPQISSSKATVSVPPQASATSSKSIEKVQSPTLTSTVPAKRNVGGKQVNQPSAGMYVLKHEASDHRERVIEY